MSNGNWRLLLVSAAWVIATLAQNATPQTISPKEVIHTLVNLEINGATLSDSRRKQVSELFLRHNLFAENPEIIVISSDYALDEIPLSRDRADVDFSFDELGVIQPSLQWRPPSPGIMKFSARYHLVFGDAYWNPGIDGRDVRLLGPVTWRIEAVHPIRLCWFSKATAIRYVTETRAKSNDPTVKANADKTLAILKKIR
jgi:hypothetical protein